jgi:hypothetical protein
VSVGIAVLVDDGLAEQDCVDQAEDVAVGVDDKEDVGAKLAVPVPVRDGVCDAVEDGAK